MCYLIYNLYFIFLVIDRIYLYLYNLSSRFETLKGNI